MKRVGSVRISMLAMLASVGALVAAPPASGVVTLGQTAPASAPLFHCEFPGPFDEFQLAVAGGNSYVVPPPGGVITSWSTMPGATTGQQLALKIFRPLGGAFFQVVAQDGPRTLSAGTLNTFPVRIPVQGGDVVGTLVPEGAKVDCLFETLLLGDQIGYREGNVGVGGTFEREEPYGEFRLNISATLLPPPVITSITPAAGSMKEATPVVIAGAHFAEVAGVSFGSVPASSFTVDSEGQITAVAPPSATPGAVPVTVTNLVGTSGPQPFTYRACIVPKLKGSKLKAAKRKANRAGCKIGKVKKLDGATAKTGRVVKQRPKPNRILAPGSKINVVLKD